MHTCVLGGGVPKYDCLTIITVEHGLSIAHYLLGEACVKGLYATTVEISIMHRVRRHPNLCIIRFMHYSICIIEISTVYSTDWNRSVYSPAVMSPSEWLANGRKQEDNDTLSSTERLETGQFRNHAVN